MFFEVLVMMFLGGLCGSGVGWVLTLDVPLMVTAGTFYGLFCYTLWRLIVDFNETAIERARSDQEPLTLGSALLAFVFPIGVLAFVIVGIVVLTVAFVVAIRKWNQPSSSY